MHTYSLTTLVDITENGLLRAQFPFTTKSGELIHDAHSLSIARNQQTNFTTLIQLLQLRSNIIWEKTPRREEVVMDQTQFGRVYEGKHTVWHFVWQVEQEDLYLFDDEVVGRLLEDFDKIPIINFCKETATFPLNAFLTQDIQTRNIIFNYLGENYTPIEQLQ